MDIFFKNIFKLELDERKLGSTNISTNINAIADPICSEFTIKYL